jgi:hypothetical protein
METESTEHNDNKTNALQLSTPLSRWIGEQITILAEIFSEPMTSARLKGYAANLLDLDIYQLKTAFTRAPRECRFFPRISELREFAGALDGKIQQDAEAHRAWDVLLDYVDTWVQADPEGAYGPEQGCRMYPPQTLDQRILDCARRLGGWKWLKTASEDDVPFLKKDFIDEYLKWEAVAHVDVSHMLKEVCPTLQLQTMDSAPENIYQRRKILEEQAAIVTKKRPPSRAKPINCEPLTDIQLRDRREMLRQQAETLQKAK